jgi:hypothetical protein
MSWAFGKDDSVVMAHTRTTISRALLVITSFALIFRSLPSDAADNPETLPSFRAMERVVKNQQSALVKEVSKFQAELVDDVAETKKQLDDQANVLAGKVLIHFGPQFAPVVQELNSSEFVKEFLAARAARIKATSGQVSAQATGVALMTTEPQNIDIQATIGQLSTTQLDRFNNLASGLFNNVSSVLNSPITQTTVNTLSGLANENSNLLNTAISTYNTLTNSTIPNTEQAIQLAQNTLNGYLGQQASLITQIASSTNLLSAAEATLTTLVPGSAEYVALANDILTFTSDLSGFNSTLSNLTNTLIPDANGLIGSLTTQLNGFIDQANLLNLVDIPFLDTAVQSLNSFFSGASLSTVFSSGQGFLSKLGFGGSIGGIGSILKLIELVGKVSQAINFVASTYQAVIAVVDLVTNLMAGDFLQAVLAIVDNPLNLAIGLVDDVGTALITKGSVSLSDTSIDKLASSAGNIFGMSVLTNFAKAIGGLSKLIDDAPGVFSGVFGSGGGSGGSGGGVVFAMKADSNRYSAPQTARAVSADPSRKLVFGDSSRKTTSKNFCSGARRGAAKKKCIKRERIIWIKFQARLRSHLRDGVKQIKSSKVRSRIQRKAFKGKTLAIILKETVSDLQGTTIPPELLTPAS